MPHEQGQEPEPPPAHALPQSPTTLWAIFADEVALLACCRALRQQGQMRLQLFSPIDLPEASQALELPPSRVPAAMLIAGTAGGALAYGLQWWTTACSYPLQVGAMPLESVPAFIPITFESTILAGCLTGFVLVLARSGLPRLWHPIAEVPGGERASRDRFVLALECPWHEHAAWEEQLRTQGALAITRGRESAA